MMQNIQNIKAFKFAVVGLLGVAVSLAAFAFVKADSPAISMCGKHAANCQRFLSTDKAVYVPNENVVVSCSTANNRFTVFDMTPGVDGNADLGGYIGDFQCSHYSSALSSSGTSGHSYVVVEGSQDQSCFGSPYESCAGAAFVTAEVDFSVQ